MQARWGIYTDERQVSQIIAVDWLLSPALIHLGEQNKPVGKGNVRFKVQAKYLASQLQKVLQRRNPKLQAYEVWFRSKARFAWWPPLAAV